jgi:hypothetical protein
MTMRVSGELRRRIGTHNGIRRKTQLATKSAPPFSVSDDQLGVIMGIAGSLPIEKRDAFLQRLAAHMKHLNICRPTNHELDTACRIALQGLLHEGSAA